MKLVRNKIANRIMGIETGIWYNKAICLSTEVKDKLLINIEEKIELDIFFRSKDNVSMSYGVFSVE